MHEDESMKITVTIRMKREDDFTFHTGTTVSGIYSERSRKDGTSSEQKSTDWQADSDRVLVENQVATTV